MQKEPKHAELPLWVDKNFEERCLNILDLVSDLNEYRASKNYPSLNFKAPETLGECDDVKSKILGVYSKTLNEDYIIILNNLNLSVPFDEHEKIDKEIIKKEILENPNIINKNCEIGHITGSALVIDSFNKKVLLHKHKKLGIWLQFGGHFDYELNPLEVAIRESKEESGLDDLKAVSYLSNINIPIDIEMQKIKEKFPKPGHFHADFRYLLNTNSPENVKALDGESDDFWWLSVEEALLQPDTLISKPVKRLILKADKYFKLSN